MIESIEEAVKIYKDGLRFVAESYEEVPVVYIKSISNNRVMKWRLGRTLLSPLDQMKFFLGLSNKEVEEIEKEVFKGSLPIKRIYEELGY